VEHGGRPDRKNWQERRETDAEFGETEPAVLVIGMSYRHLSYHLYYRLY